MPIGIRFSFTRLALTLLPIASRTVDDIRYQLIAPDIQKFPIIPNRPQAQRIDKQPKLHLMCYTER